MTSPLETVHVAASHATLGYRVQGGGPSVLLIRPLGGTMRLWGAFREQLALRYRVVTFDLRGSGHSMGGLHLGITTRDLACDALAVLDASQTDVAHVFGISLGGMVATWLAALAPERIGRLCLAAAPLRGWELRHADTRRELSLAACFLRSDTEVRLVHRVLSPEYRNAHPCRVDAIERVVRSQPSSRLALLGHALAAARHDARGAAPSIEAETLVLAGGHDRIAGIEAPRALAEAIQARFEVMSEMGHDLTLEAPVRTAARVAGYFDEPPHL